MINSKKTFLLVYAFYLLYTPNLRFITTALSPSVVLLVLCIGNIILLNRRLISFISKLSIWKTFIVFVLLIIQVALNNYINGFDVSDYVSNLVMLYNLVNYLALLIWYEKIYRNDKFIDFIICIGLAQFVISLLMLLVPAYKEVANVLYVKGEKPGMNLYGITNSRIYGIGSGYTVALPFTQSFIGVLSLYRLSETKKLKYLGYSAFLAWSSLLNNRTGMLIFLIILVIVLVKISFDNISLKVFLRTGVILLVTLFTISIFRNSEKINWLNQSIIDIIDYVVNGSKSTHMQALGHDFIKFPKCRDLFWGTGHRVFGEKSLLLFGFTSDIGYINDLFKGGMVYVLSLYSLLLGTIINRMASKYLAFLMAIFILIANYKGEIINGSAVMMLSLSISFASSCYKENMGIM